MAIPSTPLFGNPTRINDDAIIKASPGKLWAILLEGGTAASSLDFFDHASSATGAAKIGVTAPCVTATAAEADSVFINLVSLGGIDFATGIFCEHTGAAAIGYVWFS